MKHMLLGVILPCLVVLLAGCATRSPEVIRIPYPVTVIEKVHVPTELLRRCRTPNLDRIATTGDVEAIAIEALAALNTCSEDKERIREWIEADL